ncbi:MAG: hypothetical protein IJU55_05500 [Selenomonadaceae bacterium]|nr:hypothetical protein [Selenomonadaceae bacterium]
MKDKKILENEIMNDAELDLVNGGTYLESFNVAGFLYQAGFDNALNDKGGVNFAGMRSALDSIGISVEDHGGLAALGASHNVYTDKSTGQSMNQAEMMSFLRNKYPGVRYKEIVEPQSITDALGMLK